MKKLFFIVVLSFFSLTNLTAQWEILNEGFRGSLNTIDFVNDNIGWIAGSNGTLLKTTDGGENWNTILINENWHIGTIDFLNDSLGWAIGNIDSTAFIWKSLDGGFNWTVQKQILNIRLSSISALDKEIVFAIGSNKIYKTTNGGTDWIDVSPNSPKRNYNSVWFLNSATGVVVGNYNDGIRDRGVMLRTTNGGTSWNENIVNEFNNMTDLQFLNSVNGYFRAYQDSLYFLCKTEDMCLSWIIKTQSRYSITSYQLFDDNSAYATMGDSITANNIMKSSNGGVSWQNVQSFNTNFFSLDKIYFSNQRVGFILGNYRLWVSRGRYLVKSVLFQSMDGNWSMQKFSHTLSDICFINKDEGFLIGGYVHGIHYEYTGHLFSTKFGGITWNIKNSSNNNFNSILFINEFTGFCLTFMEIYKSSNSGHDWDIVYQNNLDSAGYSFYGSDICFFDESIGWAVGSYYMPDTHGAAILGTSDEGKSWNLIWKYSHTNDLWYNLYSIHLTDTIAWAVGENGMIVKYTQQSGWLKQNSVTDLPLNKVFFTDDYHGWIAGGYQNDNGFKKILLKTKNGGVDWNTISNVPYLIKDVVFLDNNFGWAIGYDSSGVGGILKSTDGGNTWIIDVGNLPAKLNALHIKEGYGWAVGDNGLILRTTNAGPTWVDDKNETLPTEFALEQNYPNPFNPTTKIRYSVPSDVKREMLNVVLNVYDVLGREVATLVNEEKDAGVYEVEFDASHLSSAVYFYQLKAGSFVQTKKMVILK